MYKWLEQLRKEGKLSIDFPLRRSYLDEGKGERFERMILYLTEMVMLKQMNDDGYEVPEILTMHNSLTLKRMSAQEKQRLDQIIDV